MTGLSQHMAFISMPGSGEWIVILIIGLLVFGRRLPDVARSLGKSVNEFKKGMREFQDSADEVTRDVNKITNEVASDVKDAAGMNDYGYKDPNSTPYTGQYGSTESTASTETGQYNPAEPSSVATEASEPAADEDPTSRDGDLAEPTT